MQGKQNLLILRPGRPPNFQATIVQITLRMMLPVLRALRSWSTEIPGVHHQAGLLVQPVSVVWQHGHHNTYSPADGD